MRLILVMLFLLLYFIVSIPIFGIEWIIGKINPHARDISSLRIVQFGFKGILFFSGTKTTVIGFENIPKGLVEAALARLEHPEATLKELGESLNPPVGKSGINHRLRKLSEMADKVRQEQGGLL